MLLFGGLAQVAVMKQLRHPNVVRLVQVLRSEERLYLVMELVAGGEVYYKLGTRFLIIIY
jgi:serine/threonine protein kinase